MIKLLKVEFYKVFIKNHIIVLLFLSCCVLVSSRVFSDTQLTFGETATDAYYATIVGDVLGEYSVEKRDLIKIKSSQSRIKVEEIQNSQFDLDSFYQRSEAETIATVWNYLESQIDYVEIDPSQRDIINVGIWNSYLLEYKIDFIAVIFTIFLSAVIFYIEYFLEMDTLLDSTKSGKRKLKYAKFSLIIIAIFVIVGVMEGAKLIHGVPQNIFSPIQSHPYFENSILNGSLICIYLIFVLLKIAGLICIAAITVYATFITRDFILPVLGSIFLNIIPSLLLKEKISSWMLPINALQPRKFIISATMLPYDVSKMYIRLVLYIVLLIIVSLLIFIKVSGFQISRIRIKKDTS